jgi:AcrR family transcriptional regulator
MLVATAKAAFSEKGSGASLDEIARTANVGAGTLYRHFPTRDALVAAVHRNATEQLVTAAMRFSRPFASPVCGSVSGHPVLSGQSLRSSN